LELFIEIMDQNTDEAKKLHTEANELLSIIVASINTARINSKPK